MGVDLLEVPSAGALASERLDDAHPGDVLGQGRRNEAEALPHVAVGPRRADPEDGGRDRHRRHHAEGREGEAPVEVEEDRGRADEDQRVLDERRDAVRDQLVEGVDVVGQAADDHAGAVPLVVAERQALEVLEELVAEVGEDPLARPAREVGLRRARCEVGEAGDHEEGDDDGQGVEVALPDAVVQRHLRQERRDEGGQGRCEQRDDRKRRLELVRRRQPSQRRNAACRPLPRPVVDLHVALPSQMAAGLPNPHRSRLTTRVAPRTWEDPTAPTRWREPRPEKRTRGPRLRAESVPAAPR